MLVESKLQILWSASCQCKLLQQAQRQPVPCSFAVEYAFEGKYMPPALPGLGLSINLYLARQTGDTFSCGKLQERQA